MLVEWRHQEASHRARTLFAIESDTLLYHELRHSYITVILSTMCNVTINLICCSSSNMETSTSFLLGLRFACNHQIMDSVTLQQVYSTISRSLFYFSWAHMYSMFITTICVYQSCVVFCVYIQILGLFSIFETKYFSIYFFQIFIQIS